MADDNKVKPAGKKPHPAIFVVIIVLVLVLLGLAQYFATVQHDVDTGEQTVAEEETTGEETAAATDETAAPAEKATIDVNAALSDRILGNPSAPVKISEHASFTCGHCGHFHKETFGQLKKDYIDTGKVYIVFSDFPLDAPAVHASMVARCLPEAKYFDFVQMLFEKQDEWAHEENYLDFLKEQAAENGLDEAHFQACINNTELRDGIVNRMKGVQGQWNISSTPSFVINNRNTISGAYPYEEFKKIIDDELSGKKSEAPAGAGNSEVAPSAATEEPADTETEEPTDEVTPEPTATDEEPAAEKEAAPATTTEPTTTAPATGTGDSAATPAE